jgi:hypothetical protein
MSVAFPIVIPRTPTEGVDVTRRISGAWNGWDGGTVVELTDGSKWKQAEYHYEYRYAYRPEVVIERDRMMVSGMRRAVRVTRLF